METIARVVLSVAAIAMSAAPLRSEEGPDKKFYDSFAQKLPAGYTLKTEYYPNTDRIVGLTPIGPDGKPDGEAVRKAPYGGEIVRTTPYKKGIRDGVEKEYDLAVEDGKQKRYLKREIPWKDDKIDGVKKMYHPNGKPMLEVTCVNGVENGPSRTYDLSGRLERDAAFKDGKRDGEMTEYWVLTGKPKSVIPYKKGKVDGVVREFHDNGKPKKEAALKDDEFHGIEKRFDEGGNLVKTAYWIRDKEVSKKEFDAQFKAP